jgi:UDP-N-acetyl-D-mannosaminuronic acid dehydrogenase
LVVVGGGGRVGLPLALSFASRGLAVGICDIDTARLETIKSGKTPFKEAGADEVLQTALRDERLFFSNSPSILKRTRTTILIVGTPIDEFLNPSLESFSRVVDEIAPQLCQNSLLILRSTVFPGTTAYVQEKLEGLGVKVEVVFCPERIAEGHALEEFQNLPQIIGADSPESLRRAREIFAPLGLEIVETSTKEAEVAKLMTNAWRYLKFAIANQFFEIAHADGLDYNRILEAIRYHYPRAADLPSPGLAAGPCLLKDTMQLAAYAADSFPMGHSAMMINEGLPRYIIDSVSQRYGLRGKTLGILGMAFKGESDDPRDSLSYKMRKLAKFAGANVLACDPYIQDPSLETLEAVMKDADIFIIAAPHARYRELDFGDSPVIDIWGLTGKGIRL